MTMQPVEHSHGLGDPPPLRPGVNDDELRELLRVFLAVRDGDFSVRLPGHWTGLVGKIADAVNDVVSANERMATQLEHVGEVDRALAAARAGRPARLRTFRTREGRSPEWWDTTIVGVPGGGDDPLLMAASRNITADIESRSLLETIVDHVPAALFAKDVNDDRYIMINQAAEDFFRRSREEMVGKTPTEVFSADEAAFIADAHSEPMATVRTTAHVTRRAGSGL